MLVLSPRREATIALVARFFAPFTSTRPRSGLPPRIASTEPAGTGTWWTSASRSGVVIRASSTQDRRGGGRESLIQSRRVPQGLVTPGPPRVPSSADGECAGPPRLAAGLELRDLVFVAQCEPDVIEPLEEPAPS